MTIRKIIKILFHPTTIKIVAVIGILWFFFVHPTFAAGAATTVDPTLKEIQSTLDKLISICSRWWVILAILAGKLMTNDFVYGAFIHMDVYLWKIRNIMKNFANFTLMALVIWAIIKSIVGKEAIDIKKTITSMLVAGILIQASWFLMGAVVDISTVATAAISSFPSAFLKNDKKLQTQIIGSISNFKAQRISYDLNATGSKDTIRLIDETTSVSAEELWDNILPNYNSISWPFVYLGMGVFQFQNYLDWVNTNEITTLTLTFILRFFLLFFFTVWLLLLVIANIMRIWLMRVFIIWAPFLVLVQLFKLKLWSLDKLLSIPNLLATVFKPVIFVAGISLMLIVIVSIQNGMMSSWAERENNLNGAVLSKEGNTSTLAIEGISNISILETNTLWTKTINESQNFFSTLLMLLLSLFLMRRFIKLSLTLGGWTISETMESLIKQAETMAKSAPVLPFKWWATSLTAMTSFAKQQRNQVLKDGLWMNAEWKFTTAEDKFNAMLNKNIFGIKPDWSNDNYTTLSSLTDKNNFMDTSINIAKETNQWLSIGGNSKRQSYLETWLKNASGKQAMNSKLKELWITTWFNFVDTFESTFKNNTYNLKALHALMWGDNALYTWWTKAESLTYDKLINNTYHKSTEK